MPSRRDGPPWHMTEMIEAEPALAERLLARLADPSSPAGALAERSERPPSAARDRRHRLRHERARRPGGGGDPARGDAQRVGLPLAPRRGGAPVAAQAFEGSLEDGLGGGRARDRRSATRAGRGRRTGRSSGPGPPGPASRSSRQDRSPAPRWPTSSSTTGELDQSWCHTSATCRRSSPRLRSGRTSRAGPSTRRRSVALLAAGLQGDAVAAVELLAEALRRPERIIVTGSGVDRVAARELALKLEEGTHIPASARDLETLLHGHLAGMDERTGLVLIAGGRDERRSPPSPSCRRTPRRRRDRLHDRRDRGSDLRRRVRGRRTAGRAERRDSRASPSRGRPLGTAVPLQLLTERIARIRGVNPDPIRRDDPAYLRAAEAPEAAARRRAPWRRRCRGAGVAEAPELCPPMHIAANLRPGPRTTHASVGIGIPEWEGKRPVGCSAGELEPIPRARPSSQALDAGQTFPIRASAMRSM